MLIIKCIRNKSFTMAEINDAELALMATQGNGRALDKLITRHMGFVITVAKEYQGQGVELDDLVSEGNIALMNAILKWNPEKTQSLVMYAVHDIRKAMEQIVERMGMLLRVPEGEDGRVKSMDAPLRQGHTRSLGETMPQKGQKEPDQSADDISVSLDLASSIGILNERESIVIKEFYGISTPNLTMAEIGEHLGLKRERVRQIRKKAEQKLRKSLRRNNNS